MPKNSLKLTVSYGRHKGQSFVIGQGEQVIGRADKGEASPSIDLGTVDEEIKVSRRHALLSRTGDKVMLEDLGSTNGTYLNRTQKLEQGKPIELRPNDEIMVGKVLLRFEVGAA